jgi:hypothetical protein
MANTFELIASYSATGSVSSIDFNSIPQTYTDLVLKVSLRNGLADVWDNADISFNGSTSPYTNQQLRGNGTSATAARSTTQPSVNYWHVVSNTATASTFGNAEFYIPNYTATINKSVSIDSVTENNATSAAATLTAGLLGNTAAITSIKLQGNGANFLIYSTAYLYGVKNA